MIRKNYSLADELRKEESRRQKNVQEKQKFKHKTEKLKNIDVNDLHRRLTSLRNKEPKTPHDIKLIKGLQDDWNFVVKHNLHPESTKKILAKVEKENKEKEVLSKKLWGEKSVYFNAELNPLGKVPDTTKLPFKPNKPLENLTVPLKVPNKNIPADPLIKKLNITPPDGSPPRFYKKVYNTGRSHITSVSNEKRPKYHD